GLDDPALLLLLRDSPATGGRAAAGATDDTRYRGGAACVVQSQPGKRAVRRARHHRDHHDDRRNGADGGDGREGKGTGNYRTDRVIADRTLRIDDRQGAALRRARVRGLPSDCCRQLLSLWSEDQGKPAAPAGDGFHLSDWSSR